MVEPAQDQHLAARQKRCVDLEARVLGRRSDQRDGAVFHEGEEAILLRTIETMDLIHEQQGLLTRASSCSGFSEHFLEVGNAGEDGGDGDEPQPNGSREQAGDGRLARAWRPPQDHRGEAARGNHPADRALGARQMILADNLAQRRRAQAIGQRRVGRGRLDLPRRDVLIGEQVSHRPLHNRRDKKCTISLAYDAAKIYLRRSKGEKDATQASWMRPSRPV